MVNLTRYALVVIVLLGCVVVARAGAQGQGTGATRRTGAPNTWSAKTSTGRVFSGTWTVKIDPATGSATGTWTLFDANGTTVARGGWSAAKEPAGWSGAWRANVFDRNGQYAGTWKVTTELPADAPFSQLFERAAEAVVGGTFQAGRQSGAWSIRAH